MRIKILILASNFIITGCISYQKVSEVSPIRSKTVLTPIPHVYCISGVESDRKDFNVESVQQAFFKHGILIQKCSTDVEKETKGLKVVVNSVRHSSDWEGSIAIWNLFSIMTLWTLPYSMNERHEVSIYGPCKTCLALELFDSKQLISWWMLPSVPFTDSWSEVYLKWTEDTVNNKIEIVSETPTP